MSRKAFTLIELLVVIAIIAILAAILFPVFAQAKEAAKKAVDLSNMKQMATGSKIYLADSDDLYPQTLPVLNGVNQESFFGTPATRTSMGAAPSQASIELRNQFWGNSVQPYIKNYQMYKNSVPDVNIFPTSFNDADTKGFADSYAMNTFLNSWSDTAINSPSLTIMFFQGMGKMNVKGVTYAYPPIGAGSLTAPYRFGRGVGQCPVAPYVYTGQADARIFTGGHNLVYCDSSAKFVRTPSSRSPWAALDPNTGVATSLWVSNIGTDCQNKIYYWHAPDQEKG